MSTTFQNWGDILRTQNLPEGRRLDPISRWLLIVRASVFPMTLISGAIGGLLAAAGPAAARADWGLFAIALIGLVLAHAANNMINDWFDTEGGVDTTAYVRTQYAPHPLLSGLISKRGLLAAIAVVNAVDLGILLYLTALRGWPVVAFALAGLFVSVFYVAPPLRLKHRGLGEPGVFLVWGPLMIAGVHYVTVGSVSPGVFAASLPYALLVTSVLVGKHIDKLEADAARGIRTLPVILGRERAIFLNQTLFAGFFVLVGILVLTGTLSAWTLLALLALPRMVRVIRVYAQPRPATRPENFPIWPLWYVAWAFVLTRLAGALLVVGLALEIWLPLSGL